MVMEGWAFQVFKDRFLRKGRKGGTVEGQKGNFESPITGIVP